VAWFLPAPATGSYLGVLLMKRRILLADDDESVRKMVGRVLESEDYDVILARTGAEAIKKALVGSPDLVLLDINMPDKDGWEAFKLIDRILPLVPVIVITARPDQQECAMRVGIDALMEKPLDLAVLLKTIRDLLDESDLERVKRPKDPSSSSPCIAEGR
jgi:DNA-binding response OmpR family regulator